MYYDDFDPFHDATEREVYEDDLQEFSDREAWEDERYEREEHSWEDRDEVEPEDRYLDSSFEDRYYIETGEYEY